MGTYSMNLSDRQWFCILCGMSAGRGIKDRNSPHSKKKIIDPDNFVKGTGESDITLEFIKQGEFDVIDAVGGVTQISVTGDTYDSDRLDNDPTKQTASYYSNGSSLVGMMLTQRNAVEFNRTGVYKTWQRNGSSYEEISSTVDLQQANRMRGIIYADQGQTTCNLAVIMHVKKNYGKVYELHIGIDYLLDMDLEHIYTSGFDSVNIVDTVMYIDGAYRAIKTAVFESASGVQLNIGTTICLGFLRFKSIPFPYLSVGTPYFPNNKWRRNSFIRTSISNIVLNNNQDSPEWMDAKNEGTGTENDSGWGFEVCSWDEEYIYTNEYGVYVNTIGIADGIAVAAKAYEDYKTALTDELDDIGGIEVWKSTEDDEDTSQLVDELGRKYGRVTFESDISIDSDAALVIYIEDGNTGEQVTPGVVVNIDSDTTHISVDIPIVSENELNGDNYNIVVGRIDNNESANPASGGLTLGGDDSDISVVSMSSASAPIYIGGEKHEDIIRLYDTIEVEESAVVDTDVSVDDTLQLSDDVDVTEEFIYSGESDIEDSFEINDELQISTRVVVTYAVTGSIDPSTSTTTISGLGSYEEGAIVSLTANLETDYVVKEWLVDGVSYGSSNSISFNMPGHAVSVTLKVKLNQLDAFSKAVNAEGSSIVCTNTGAIPWLAGMVYDNNQGKQVPAANSPGGISQYGTTSFFAAVEDTGTMHVNIQHAGVSRCGIIVYRNNTQILAISSGNYYWNWEQTFAVSAGDTIEFRFYCNSSQSLQGSVNVWNMQVV